MKNIIFVALALFGFNSLCSSEVISGWGAERNNWNLIANFREGSGTTTMDSSSNTLVLTLAGGTAWVSNRTGSGNAVFLDGTNDTVIIPSEGLFDLDCVSTFTIIVHFKITQTPFGTWCMVGKGSTWPSNSFVFNTSNGLGVFIRDNGSSYCYFDTAATLPSARINDGKWHTAGLIYRGIYKIPSRNDFYFDGERFPAVLNDCPAGGVSMLNNDNLTIGNVSNGVLTHFPGTIGTVMVSRIGYAPTAQGMMDLHRRLMGQIGQKDK